MLFGVFVLYIVCTVQFFGFMCVQMFACLSRVCVVLVLIAAPAGYGRHRSPGAACLTRRTAGRENSNFTKRYMRVSVAYKSGVLPACTRAGQA